MGLVIAGAVGVAAFAAAVRWNAQEIAGIGLVGSLLAPVLVGTGTSTSASSSWRSLSSRRSRLSCSAAGSGSPPSRTSSAPASCGLALQRNDVHLGAAIAVAGAFWLLYVAAAVGYELLNPAEEDELRYSTASLLLVNAVVAAAGGWF